jgi:hypothetical protein
MQKIPLSLARNGMILAKEVVRPEKPEGPPLFGKGMTLSDTHIERLAGLGIQTIVVEGRPVVMEGDESLGDQLNNLEERFTRCGQDAFMQKLKAALQRHIAKMMGA